MNDVPGPLTAIQQRLQAPFTSHLVQWRPVKFNAERSQALVRPHIGVQAVQDRFDTVCPNDWAFELTVLGGTPPSVKGRLTVVGLVRENVGQAEQRDGHPGTLQDAVSDAFVRCAEQFGVGRYLRDVPAQWVFSNMLDDLRLQEDAPDWAQPKQSTGEAPTLPEWAQAEFERSPGTQHLLSVLAEMNASLPQDLDRQREVLRHLNAALNAAGAGTGAALEDGPNTTHPGGPS